MNQNSKMNRLAFLGLGFCLALMLAQAAPTATTFFSFDRYPVGRYQLVARGNTKDVWIIDTATGNYRFYTPVTTNTVPTPMALQHRDRFHLDNYSAESMARKDWKQSPDDAKSDDQ